MEFHGGGLGEGHLHRNLILQKMLHTYKDAATISFTERPEIIWAALDRLFKEIEVKTQELRIPVWRPYVTKEEREKAGAPLFWAGFTLSAIVALPTFRFGQTWWNKGRTWFAGMRGTSGGAGRLRLNGPGAGSAVGNANHSFGRRLLGRWKYNWWPKIRGMLGYFFYKAKKPSTPAASSTSPASSTSVATQGTLPTHPYRPASGGSSPVSPVTMLPAVQNTAIGPGVAGAAAKANGPWFRTMWPGLGKKLTAGVPRLVKPVAGAALVGLAGGGLYRFFQLRKIQQWPPMTTLRVGQEWIARHVLKDQVKTFKFRLENLIDQKEKGLFPGEYTDPGLMRINEELDLIERDMQRIESQIKYLSKALHENGGSPLVSSVEGVTSLATLIGDDINLVRDHCLVIKEILAERGLINFDENIRAQLANRLVSTINRNYNWLQSWKKRVDGDEDAEPMPSLTQDEFDDFYNSFVEISANFSDRKAQAERYATLTNAAGEPLITDLETLSERVVKNGKVADELIDAFDKLVVDQAEELEDQVADEMEENAAAASEAGPDLPTPTESVTNPAALEPESPSAEQTSAGHANPK